MPNGGDVGGSSDRSLCGHFQTANHCRVVMVAHLNTTQLSLQSALAVGQL